VHVVDGMDNGRERRSGFSLVEVSLAMMIISIGMITLFGLFPASLKQGEAAYKDTHAAQFAEYALNGLRANFSGASSFSEWSAPSAAIGLTGLGFTPTGIPLKFEYPIGSGNFVRYILELAPPVGTLMNWQVRIWVWSGEYGPKDVAVHKRRSQWFATEIFYEGMH
jgi:prepilin-type N-terminal cleavage/methylation domain-containing protein